MAANVSETCCTKFGIVTSKQYFRGEDRRMDLRLMQLPSQCGEDDIASKRRHCFGRMHEELVPQ